MKFGDKIKYLRELRGYTLKGLESVSGVSQSYISDIENDRATTDSVSIGKLRALANALQCKAEFLIREDLVSFDELAEFAGITLPDDVIRFLSNQKNLPYLELAKKAQEQGIPAEIAQRAIEQIRALMDDIQK